MAWIRLRSQRRQESVSQRRRASSLTPDLCTLHSSSTTSLPPLRPARGGSRCGRTRSWCWCSRPPSAACGRRGPRRPCRGSPPIVCTRSPRFIAPSMSCFCCSCRFRERRIIKMNRIITRMIGNHRPRLWTNCAQPGAGCGRGGRSAVAWAMNVAVVGQDRGDGQAVSLCKSVRGQESAVRPRRRRRIRLTPDP